MLITTSAYEVLNAVHAEIVAASSTFNPSPYVVRDMRALRFENYSAHRMNKSTRATRGKRHASQRSRSRRRKEA